MRGPEGFAGSELVMADLANDVRGLKVLGTNGDDLGDADGIIIDEQKRRARFLGIGETKQLIAVEAMTGA